MVVHGNLIVDGRAYGTAALLTGKLAVTADHVLRAALAKQAKDPERSQLMLECPGWEPAILRPLNRDEDLDVAILEVVNDVWLGISPVAIGHPHAQCAWEVTSRPRSNDAGLTGRIEFARRPILNRRGHPIIAVQLGVDQLDLETFGGYSGSVVVCHAANSHADVVVGVLVEQLPGRRDGDTATNVVYAIPIVDVVAKFQLNLVEHPEFGPISTAESISQELEIRTRSLRSQRRRNDFLADREFYEVGGTAAVRALLSSDWREQVRIAVGTILAGPGPTVSLSSWAQLVAISFDWTSESILEALKGVAWNEIHAAISSASQGHATDGRWAGSARKAVAQLKSATTTPRFGTVLLILGGFGSGRQRLVTELLLDISPLTIFVQFAAGTGIDKSVLEAVCLATGHRWENLNSFERFLAEMNQRVLFVVENADRIFRTALAGPLGISRLQEFVDVHSVRDRFRWLFVGDEARAAQMFKGQINFWLTYAPENVSPTPDVSIPSETFVVLDSLNIAGGIASSISTWANPDENGPSELYLLLNGPEIIPPWVLQPLPSWLLADHVAQDGFTTINQPSYVDQVLERLYLAVSDELDLDLEQVSRAFSVLAGRFSGLLASVQTFAELIEHLSSDQQLESHECRALVDELVIRRILFASSTPGRPGRDIELGLPEIWAALIAEIRISNDFANGGEDAIIELFESTTPMGQALHSAIVQAVMLRLFAIDHSSAARMWGQLIAHELKFLDLMLTVGPSVPEAQQMQLATTLKVMEKGPPASTVTDETIFSLVRFSWLASPTSWSARDRITSVCKFYGRIGVMGLGPYLLHALRAVLSRPIVGGPPAVAAAIKGLNGCESAGIAAPVAALARNMLATSGIMSARGISEVVIRFVLLSSKGRRTLSEDRLSFARLFIRSAVKDIVKNEGVNAFAILAGDGWFGGYEERVDVPLAQSLLEEANNALGSIYDRNGRGRNGPFLEMMSALVQGRWIRRLNPLVQKSCAFFILRHTRSTHGIRKHSVPQDLRKYLVELYSDPHLRQMIPYGYWIDMAEANGIELTHREDHPGRTQKAPRDGRRGGTHGAEDNRQSGRRRRGTASTGQSKKVSRSLRRNDLPGSAGVRGRRQNEEDPSPNSKSRSPRRVRRRKRPQDPSP